VAHDTMVTQTLTKEMIDSGAALLRALDARRFAVTGACWFYLENSDVWTLIIASPEVQTRGPKRIYGSIQQILGTGSALTLRDISVLPSDDPIVTLLKGAVRTGPHDISGIRFSRNTINGHFIEDAYIYRSV
jgi:hypothetical protein